MMPFYAPFGPFSNYNHRRVNNYYSPYNNLHNSNLNNNNFKENSYFPSVSSKQTQGNFDYSLNNNNSIKNDNYNIKNEYINDSNNNIFEIFGLKLAFDDLLIIAMLFFLYKEEVKDTYLYMALILLLLT